MRWWCVCVCVRAPVCVCVCVCVCECDFNFLSKVTVSPLCWFVFKYVIICSFINSYRFKFPTLTHLKTTCPPPIFTWSCLCRLRPWNNEKCEGGLRRVLKSNKIVKNSKNRGLGNGNRAFCSALDAFIWAWKSVRLCSMDSNKAIDQSGNFTLLTEALCKI